MWLICKVHVEVNELDETTHRPSPHTWKRKKVTPALDHNMSTKKTPGSYTSRGTRWKLNQQLN